MAERSARKSHAYRALCRTVRREEDRCWLCLHPIDLALSYRDPRTGRVNPMSWSLDHVVPINKGGPELDRRNARAAHFGCNSARGDRAPTRTTTSARPSLVTSRDW